MIAIRTAGAFIVLAALFLAGCGEEESSSQSERRLNIAAAANLRFAFDDLVEAFRLEHPATWVQVSYGSSANLFAQVLNGAPFDIFFAADVSYADKVVEARLADPSHEFVYAIGQIVVWVRSDSPNDVSNLGVETLLQPAVRKIAIANPRFAPYGRAAEEALRNLGVYEQVEQKLVRGEAITQAAQLVKSGAADVGVIALSIALAPAMREQGRYWVIPQTNYTPLKQAAVVLKSAANPDEAREFRQFVTSPRGQDIMKQFGFQPSE